MRNILLVVALMLGSWGCKSAPPATPVAEKSSARNIGAVCDLLGYSAVRVDGYGLVYDLPGTGSSECPPTQRLFLVERLRQLKDNGEIPRHYEHLTAEQILDHPTTAVVFVSGLVPPGAPRGEAFDVEVTVLPQTQTTSLQGGWLLPTELQIVVPGEGGRLLARHAAALAAGPIFINPFPLEREKDVRSDPRRGVVLGGGRSLRDRNIELSLLQPDYRLAAQIERRINTRFTEPGGKRLTEATRSRVRISIPDDYRDRYHHFVKLLLSLDLEDRPGAKDLRLRELDELVQRPDADYEAIALAWETIGRDSLRHIAPLYQQGGGKAAFYAARTALNLRDLTALDAMIKMAQDDAHPCQLDATKALVEVCSDPRALRARLAMSSLLDHANTRLRLLAYEGLRRSGDRRIKKVALPGGFTLERAPSRTGNLLCIWATTQPRVILIGNDWRCPPNIFFESDDRKVMINAAADATEFTIIRRPSERSGAVSTTANLCADELIYALGSPVKPKEANRREVQGLTYSQIVGILYRLCEGQKAIPATFYLYRRTEEPTG